MGRQTLILRWENAFKRQSFMLMHILDWNIVADLDKVKDINQKYTIKWNSSHTLLHHLQLNKWRCKHEIIDSKLSFNTDDGHTVLLLYSLFFPDYNIHEIFGLICIIGNLQHPFQSNWQFKLLRAWIIQAPTLDLIGAKMANLQHFKIYKFYPLSFTS